MVAFTLLPLFGFVPATQRLLPRQVRQSLLADDGMSDQREQTRMLVFAWFPHHPATESGRCVDTRVAVWPLWREIGPDMTAKGVRTEGRSLGATGPIIGRRTMT